MQPLILSIETSTKNCSVALGHGSEILASRDEYSDQYIHSEKLHLFIRDVVRQAGYSLSDIQAVAVGRGPGSYTGLRIGVSAAKGLCYALSVPLLSADGLQVLVYDFVSKNEPAADELIIPMLDARRMEVYASVHNARGDRLKEIAALIIDETSFSEWQAPKIHLIGDGAPKCREVLDGSRFVFHQWPFPTASALIPIAQEKLRSGQTEDVAYFEPFYLKDFVAGKPKKML